jgi:hypothetical protein
MQQDRLPVGCCQLLLFDLIARRKYVELSDGRQY